MPHLILETTADLYENANIPDMLEALVRRLSKFETIDPKAIKAYHTLRSNWSMGEGAPPGFCHLTVGIMGGRPLELRKRIADGMYEELCSHLNLSVDHDDISITLEVREFDPDTYRKR